MALEMILTSEEKEPVLALNGVSLDLPPGRIVGLLGPNGSGKTTFIKIVAGLLKPNAGEVFVCGHEVGVESKKRVSYLPERTYLAGWMKVRDVLAYFTDFYADFNSALACEMLARLDIGQNDRLKAMSKGTKEKVQLILVMSRDADLFLLDEPIGGVDPAARDYILETILKGYNRRGSMIISTHLIADIEKVLDDTIFIKQGQVVRYGPVESIVQNEGKTLDEYFKEVFRC